MSAHRALDLRTPFPEQPTVAILVTSFLDPRTGAVIDGGRPRIVRDVARHLVERDFAVVVLQKGLADSVVQWETGITVHTVRCPIPTWGDPVFALRARGITRSAALCCYATPDDGFPFFSERSFAIQHGVWWDGPQYAGLKGLLARILQRIRNLALCRRTKLVLCVDSNFANYMRLLGPASYRAARKCVYLPNYADLSRFPTPSARRVQSRFAGRKLLFLRRFEPNRGPLLFLDVCKQLKDAEFDFLAEMVGWGKEAPLVARRIAELGLQDRVSVRSSSLDGVAKALDDAAISVVPSLWSEGTSLSAIESIAMGVPVVATDVGGLANVVIPSFNGEVVPADAAALARAVIRTLSSQPWYETLSANCVRMRSAFSKDRWIDRFDEILGNAGVLEPPREGPSMPAVISVPSRTAKPVA
ncbi:MAG: glycosyltransferase family 4 protein [Acidobacteria bacterium]|nr:glycosyltransferase family 4 protein [Acidobacteriota bacterium]